MPIAVSSVTTLPGALRVNGALGMAAYEDLGGKVAQLISAVAILGTNLSLVILAIGSANASGVTFSAFSGVTTTSNMVITNFRTTGPV